MEERCIKEKFCLSHSFLISSRSYEFHRFFFSFVTRQHGFDVTKPSRSDRGLRGGGGGPFFMWLYLFFLFSLFATKQLAHDYLLDTFRALLKASEPRETRGELSL